MLHAMLLTTIATLLQPCSTLRASCSAVRAFSTLRWFLASVPIDHDASTIHPAAVKLSDCLICLLHGVEASKAGAILINLDPLASASLAHDRIQLLVRSAGVQVSKPNSALGIQRIVHDVESGQPWL